MPTSLPSASTTGTPLIRCCAISACASAKVAVGTIVTGLTTMPDSKRFTWRTAATCSSGVRLRWSTPMPPNCAMAIAICASVTVSIAEDRIGMLSRMPRVSSVRVSAWLGSTAEAAGVRSTSSKVRPRRMSMTGL